jgi:nitrile hydratase
MWICNEMQPMQPMVPTVSAMRRLLASIWSIVEPTRATTLPPHPAMSAAVAAGRRAPCAGRRAPCTEQRHELGADLQRPSLARFTGVMRRPRPRTLYAASPTGTPMSTPQDHDHDHAHDQAHAHEHHHGHGDEPAHSALDAMDVRVRALETLLTEKGYVDPATVDRLIETYEVQIGPHNGARVVARAWADAAFREWLARDATAAIASMGFAGRQGEHMVAVFNGAGEHHMVVCTLCSCYPWPVLGLPPAWYKSAAYRSRAVREPRAVLAEFGVTLPAATQLRVWDSTAEVHYLVVPMRPAGTDGWSEHQLAALVSRDSMIGTGLARPANAEAGA